MHVGVNEESQIVFDVRTNVGQNGGAKQVIDVDVEIETGGGFVDGGKEANALGGRLARVLEKTNVYLVCRQNTFFCLCKP